MTTADPIAELSRLLKEAGLVPYLHKPDCGMWRKLGCDKMCGPAKVRGR